MRRIDRKEARSPQSVGLGGTARRPASLVSYPRPQPLPPPAPRPILGGESSPKAA